MSLFLADAESFLRNPGEILERLRERVFMQDGERQRRQKELSELAGRLQQKGGERDRVLGLFRRGRIDDATLDQQLDLIDAEAAGLQKSRMQTAPSRLETRLCNFSLLSRCWQPSGSASTVRFHRN